MALLGRLGGVDSVMLPVPDSRESGAHRGGAYALPGGGDRHRVRRFDLTAYRVLPERAAAPVGAA
jgi:hypothetical protein